MSEQHSEQLSQQRLAERVHVLLTECLAEASELPEDRSIKVEGIAHDFVFDRERVKVRRTDIAAICNELPPEFQLSIGGGASFLSLCVDRHGEQWGEHIHCEGIIALAIASDLGGYALPRHCWPAMPGGVPFVYFKTEGLVTPTPPDPGQNVSVG